ncbi:MAG: 16S rRNA (guanine(966)-N(2))-methyltransferase RsmD [Actinobacteria bacterium]|nr:16S rRNA (guanine(966)-N(2))-methyltransferase RsmD [Actinomycetota bacterium]
MRIIAGKARGRRLRAPDATSTRPVTDRVKEAIFSSIGSWVEDADVADLYAGSGSFGLEALSRGAASALFVESGRKAIQALRSNVETLGLGGEIREMTVQDYLRRSEGRFHLVFIDPPWDMGSDALGADFEMLDRMLAPEGEVVVSRRHDDRPPKPPVTWTVLADRRYGDTRVFRYEKGAD